MTTFTSPHNLPLIEPVTDYIKDGNEVSALAADINALAMAAASAISIEGSRAENAGKFVKPAVGSTTDIRTLTEPGGYPIRFTSNPNGVGYSGFLIVGQSMNGTLVQVSQLMLTEGDGVHYQSSRDGAWKPWEKLVTAGDVMPIRAPLTTTDDFNTVFTPGIYPVPFSTNPNGLSVSGTLYVNNAGHSTLALVSQLFIATDGGGMHYQSARDGVWTGWSEAGTPKDAADKGAARHELLRSEFMRRRGGKIGTAGKAVVSLRFDHHLDPFVAQVVPLLKKYRLPWSQVFNAASPFSDDGLTLAQLETLCLNNGGEVWNHGYSHGDAVAPAALRREVVTSLDILKTGMPNLAIEGFAPPGLADGGYGGAAPFRTVDQWDTLAGRMILANHGAVSGYMGGHFRPLGGDPAIGHSHYTLDTGLAHHWTNAVDRAISTGTALAIMVHPSALVDGQTTVAILESGLAYIAAKRDAGLLEVLSPSASLLADASSSYRRNLLGTATMAAGVGITLNLETLDFRGAIHELKVTGKTTLTATSDAGGLSATVTETVGTETRLLFNVPLGASTITLTSTAAVTNARLTAA